METDGERTWGDASHFVDVLSQTPVFKQLGREDLGMLSGRAQRRFYTREEYIEAPESEQDVVCIVVSGTVRLLRLTQDAREYELGHRVKGETFVLRRVDWTHPHETVAQAARNGTSILVLNLTVVEDMVVARPEAAREVIRFLLQRLREQEYMLGELALCTVRTRLIHLLLQHAIGVGGTWMVPDTHHQLAAQIGCRREAVTRELAVLRSRGLIETSPYRHGLVLLDRTALDAGEETNLS